MAGSQRFVPISTRSPAPLAPAGVLASDPQGLTSLVDQNLGGGGPGGPVGTTGATNTGEGLPGIGPTDGTAVGGGNMNLSQTIDAAISGIPGGAIGQMADSSAVGLGGKAAMTIGSLLGGHLGPLGTFNTVMGPVVGIARGAQNSVGPTRGQTFSEASKEFVDGLRSLFGLGPAPPAPPPNIDIRDPNLKSLTDFEVHHDDAIPDATFPDAPPGPTYPDMDVTFPDVGQGGNTPTGSDSGIGPGVGGNPGGEPGDMFHGGEVHGPGGRDRVPTNLTAGEFVVDADSARRFGPLLESLNRWAPGDDDGGLTSLVRRR